MIIHGTNQLELELVASKRNKKEKTAMQRVLVVLKKSHWLYFVLGE